MTDFGVRIGAKYYIRYIPKNSCASRTNEIKTNDAILKVRRYYSMNNFGDIFDLIFGVQINGIDISEIPTMKDVHTLINGTQGALELIVESNASDVPTALATLPSPTLTSAPNSLL